MLLQQRWDSLSCEGGVDAPAGLDGRSVLPLIRGEDTAWRDVVHGEHSTCYDPSQEMQYLTDGRWKFVWFPRNAPGAPQEQLFDLAADPYERHDLASRAEYAADVRRWRSRLAEILAPRQSGLVERRRLVAQHDRPPLVSPAAADRRPPR